MPKPLPLTELQTSERMYEIRAEEAAVLARTGARLMLYKLLEDGVITDNNISPYVVEYDFVASEPTAREERACKYIGRAVIPHINLVPAKPGPGDCNGGSEPA